MATVNKTSLRSEFDALKSRFEALCARGKVSAERDLRMSKVRQKISGCFRTTRYAAAYCGISSYIQSMGQQGYNPMSAVQIALDGKAAAHLLNPNITPHVTENQMQGHE